MAQPIGKGSITLAETVGQIERALHGGAMADARQTLLDCLAAEGSGLVAVSDAGRISTNAGLAWLCDKLASENPGAGYERKALGYGQAALLLDPRDGLAYALLPEEQIHLIAHNLLRHRKPAAARTLLRRLRDTSNSAATGHLLELMDFVEDERRRIDEMPAADGGRNKPLLINAIVWGDAYVDALFTYAFPSLLASGNLPRVSRDRDVIFDFYTSERDRARVDGHPVTKALKRFAKFRYNVIPDSLLAVDANDFARWCAGGAQQCSALRAQRLGADLMFLCGSAVYSAQCMARAYDFIAEGYRAVACVMPRTQETRAYEALARHAEIAGGRIEVDAAGLSAFVVNNLHRHCIDSFISAMERSIAQNPVALFFKTDTGFCCRTYEPSPLIISHDLLTKGFEPDYFTIDVRFLSELLGACAYDTVVKAVHAPEEGIAVTDVDCGGGPAMRRYGDISLTVGTCADGALHSATRDADIDYFRWALAQRFTFHAGEGADKLPGDGLREADAISRVVALIDEKRRDARSRIAVFERLPEHARR